MDFPSKRETAQRKNEKEACRKANGSSVLERPKVVNITAGILEAAKITIELLDSWKDEDRVEDVLKLDYNFTAPEDFLQEHFAQHDYSIQLEDDITEFFFKICKYRKFLTAVEKEFLGRSLCGGGDGSCGESSLNLVLLHLVLIELNEFSKHKILELMMSLNEKKAIQLLTIFKKPSAMGKVHILGCQIWDVEYVSELLQNVLQKELLEEVYETVTDQRKNVNKFPKKQLTVPVGPRCLTYKKKFIPQSENWVPPHRPLTRIPIMIRSNPIPISTYVKPNYLKKIEKVSEKHREEAKTKFLEAQNKAFRCAKVEKSEKFKNVIEKIEMERMRVPPKKISSYKAKPREGKLPKKTATVILREGARLLKLEQEEIKRYEDLENGGFNNDMTADWEKEIREETYRKHIEDIEKKHLEGLLSYEEALIAKQNYLKAKKEKAAEFRKEKENWLNRLEMLRKEEQIRIQENVEKGKATEKGAKDAMEHVREEKHKIVLETMEESRALKEKLLKEKEQDLQRKVELIKVIKALQAFSAVKRKQTDFTETANLGFLYEMSIAELKERLFILKIEFQEELEKRRAKVKMKRDCRKEMIDSYQELIESHQRILQEEKQKSEYDVEKDEIKNKARPARSSSSLESLRRKLYEKRRERIKQ